MSNYTIALDIVARNLAGSVFGQVFGNLTMLAMVGEQLGTAVDGTLTPLGSLIGVLVGTGAAFAIFSTGMRTAIDDASQFEYQLARLQNATGATDAEFAGMAQNIQDVAGASIFNTTEVSEAYTVMANNLIPISTIIGGLGQDAITLSEAMGTDAVSGAQLLTQAFRDFSNQGWTGQQMIDMLTRAFHDGMPDVSGMASLLGTAGGNADAMGVSLQDLLTIADILSPAMGSVSKAGTSINYMLTGITDPTSKANAEFQKLGLILADGTNHFYDAQGNFLGLKNVIDQLQQSLSGMTNEQKAQALDQLFNVRSGQGARILTDLQDFSTKYNQIFGDLGQTGAAQEAADRLVGTWQGRLNELKTNIQSLFANIGQNIIDPLKPGIKALSDFIDKLAHNKGLDEFLGHFLLAGTVISGLTLLAIGLGLAISLLAPVLALAGAAFLGIAGFSAEVALAWQFLQTHGKQVHEVLNGIGDALGHVRDFLGFVRDQWESLWNKIQPQLAPLGDVFHQTFDTIGPALQNFGDALQRIGQSIPQDQLDRLGDWLKVIGTFLGGTFLVVVAAVVIAIIGFGATIITFFAGLVSTLIDAAALIVDTLHGIGSVLDDIRTGHLDRAQADWNNAWSHMADDGRKFGSDLVNTVNNTMNQLSNTKDIAQSIGTSIGDGLFNGYKQSMDGHYEEFVRIAGNTADGIARPLRFQSPPKEGPLSDSDTWGAKFIDLLTTGMVGRLSTLSTTVGRVAGTMAQTPGMVAAQASTAGVTGQGVIEVPVYLDGQEIARSTFDVLKGQLKGMGMSRLYK